MKPEPSLIEALRWWRAAVQAGDGRQFALHLQDEIDKVKDARALYPTPHALGDRVSVVYPPEKHPEYEDFTGTVTGVEFHTDGIDYRVTGDGDPDYTVVDSAFVHPATSDPLASWFPMDGRRVSPRVAAQMHDMAVATGRVPAEAPTDVSAIPKRTGAPKNEYVCLLLGGNPLTRCVLASGHEGACVARDPDDKHTRFVAAIRAEFAATVRDGDVSYMRGRISAFDKAVEIAETIWTGE